MSDEGIFAYSSEVKTMASKLIDRFHPHLVDAKDKVAYFIKEGLTSAGKCKRCTAFERHVMEGIMFIILIDRDFWNAAMPDQKLALVDHELCHIGRNTQTMEGEEGKAVKAWCDAADPKSWKLVDHDVEEFGAIIKRHGLWDSSREKFGEAVRAAPHQMTLADQMRQEDKQRMAS